MHTHAKQRKQCNAAATQAIALATATADSCSTAVAAVSNSEDHCYSFVFNAVLSAMFSASAMFEAADIAKVSQDTADLVSDYYEDINASAIHSIVQQRVYVALIPHVIVAQA